ncbi:MAG: hypothetical protein E7507_07905 [Ruminococcus sp.]|nr:hypothetical protein [Ruminococcus sp.]
MKPLLIIYFSGVGNTRAVAESIKKYAERKIPTEIYAVIDGYPIINKAKCMNCYRCIHHCPSLALSLSAKRTVKKVRAE